MITVNTLGPQDTKVRGKLRKELNRFLPLSSQGHTKKGRKLHQENQPKQRNKKTEKNNRLKKRKKQEGKG